jgi:hypothetical protein
VAAATTVLAFLAWALDKPLIGPDVAQTGPGSGFEPPTAEAMVTDPIKVAARPATAVAARTFEIDMP